MQSIIQTPTNNLTKSLNFYQRLNFHVLSEKNPTLVSDGKATIEINANRFARAGFKLFADNWSAIVTKLEQLVKVISIEDGYLLSDLSGVWIYLMETTAPNFEVSTLSPSVLGNYAGISLETIDIEKSMKLYNILGFQKSMGGLEQGWIALTNNDGFTVSLLKPNSCPHLFFNPSLTYFNGKENIGIIEKIRALTIPITEEITIFNKEGIVDNIIIRDPGGYGFFLFSD